MHQIAAAPVIGVRVPVGHHHRQAMTRNMFGEPADRRTRVALHAVPDQHGRLRLITEKVDETTGCVFDCLHTLEATEPPDDYDRAACTTACTISPCRQSTASRVGSTTCSSPSRWGSR